MASNLVVKCLLVMAFAWLSSAQAASSYRYRVTVLIPFTPGQGSGVATLINNHGLICGAQSGSFKAFCYYRGVLTDLQPLPGDAITVASGVNDLGQVVGRSYTFDPDGPNHAVIFVNSVAQPLAVNSHWSSDAGDINNVGVIAGALADAPGEARAYASWLGVVRELGTLGGPRRIDRANGVNDRGQIVGYASAPGTQPETGSYVAFLYDKGVMRALSRPAGADSYAVRINLFGQAIGAIQPYGDQDGVRPVLWEHGVRKVLNNEAGDARDINNLGQVVGGTYNRPGGFLYHPSTGARDLNTLIDPASGYTIVYPQAINDVQQIVGYGCKEQLCGPVLLDPVHAHGGVGRIEEESAAVMGKGER